MTAERGRGDGRRRGRVVGGDGAGGVHDLIHLRAGDAALCVPGTTLFIAPALVPGRRALSGRIAQHEVFVWCGFGIFTTSEVGTIPTPFGEKPLTIFRPTRNYGHASG